MLNHSDIMSTVDMIDHQHLDIRTITMGISLLDCADPNPEACARKIHDKICRQAEHLVTTGCQIERELGIPIVNKRISVTPIALVASACETEDFVPFAKAMDSAAKTCGVDFIGGFSALVQKGMASGDRRLIAAIPQALAETELVCSSVNVATTKAGINMDAVRLMGQAIKKTAELTKERDGLGCAKLVVFCNAVEDNPFMAGAFHGVGEADAVVSVGVSGPGVVYHALQSVKGRPFGEVAECIKKTAFRITRMGQLVAQEASRRLGVPFGVVDLSLAPTPAVGDSVARILEEIYEPVFSEHSHGFRKEHSCHTALAEFKHNWNGMKWIIEADIKGCFDNINHDVLLEVLAKRIEDRRFLKLIKSFLKVGYMEEWEYHSTYSGAPQGGIISPLFANIYLNDWINISVRWQKTLKSQEIQSALLNTEQLSVSDLNYLRQ